VSLPARLLGANPSVQVSSLLTGNFALPSAKLPFYEASDYVALSTYVVPAGGVSSVTFAGIPNNEKYEHLQFRILARTDVSSAGHNIGHYLRFNNASSSYKWHELFTVGSGTVSAYTDSSQFIYTATYAPRGGDTADIFSSQVVDIFDFNNLSKYKTVRTFAGSTTDSYGFVGLMTGHYQSFDAIHTVKFFPESGNFAENSVFSLYGIKG
jgi:hypothetical protein